MTEVELVLVLLLAVVVSSFVSRMLPRFIPEPFVQIALGVGIGLVGDYSVALEPELFLMLFVPPLLFLDGWRMPKDTLFRDAGAILGLALGLVFLTVAGVGLFIHWMIPAMPTAVAFAVAAVISPTDPVAVSAIAKSSPVPPRMMHILEGESLLNDASGLVCLKFAIAAALSGSFVLSDAAGSFAWMAAGGIGAGVLVAWSITRVEAMVVAHFHEDTGATILVSLLIPFAAYLLSEHIGASGVLAAAAAGIVMTFARSIDTFAAVTRVRSRVVWDMLQFALNGVMFVLLGEQIPRIAAYLPDTLEQAGQSSMWALVGYLAAILTALIVLRLGWVWLALRLTLFRAKRRGHAHEGPPLQLIGAVGTAGARGAITLAGILTLPIAMRDGTPFPARDLAIFLASGIIILSLLVATIGLPLLLRGLHLPAEDRDARETDKALTAAADAAIAAIDAKKRAHDGDDAAANAYASIATRMIDGYRERIDTLGKMPSEDHGHDRYEIARDLRRIAAQAERQAVLDLRHRREIGSEVAETLIRRFDIMETQAER